MARWWTSDLHLGHDNICAYSHRPYADAESMNADLVDRWNSVVSPEDEVWVLGDFALGRVEVTLGLARRLHGRKTLVPGNHDQCWHGMQESGQAAPRWVTAYGEAGFSIAPGPARVRFGELVVRAHHFPYYGDSQDRDRYLEHRPADDGDWLLHGHVHDKWQQHGRMINVGVDAWGGYPVSDAQVIALIADGPAVRSPLTWQPLQGLRRRVA